MRPPRRSTTRTALAAALIALAATGCRRDFDEEATLPPAPAGAPVVLTDTFEDLYPVFLMRKVSVANKAAVWRDRYQGRWVRWTGTLRTVTPNGATFKHLPATILFDTSVRLDGPARERVRKLKPGDRVVYTAQLVRYEEVVRVFHLVHGDVAPAP